MFANKLWSLIALSLSLIKFSSSQLSWLPSYHLSPKKGWMNDPNGLIYHKGYYHAFWQYYPNGTLPNGLMHWGHARSRDMLRWEHLPIALTPSMPDDVDGIFSGSAAIKDGKMYLMYTGVSEGNKKQRQMLAVSSHNDVRFKKLGVVIVRSDGDEANFRDPKVWRQDGTWYVVIGTQTPEKRGEVLLYKSANLFNWTFDRILARSEDDKLGYMWECPDFIALGGKQLLIVNPQGMKPQGHDYQNLYQTGYFVGTWKPGENFTIEKGFREIDHGHDFYASQTFSSPDGRRIMIGWLDMWESVFPESREGWVGMFSLPRELTLAKSGDLRVRPVREVRKHRLRRKISLSRQPIAMLKEGDRNKVLIGMEDLLRNEIRIDFDLSTLTCREFGIQISNKVRSAEGIDFEGVRVFVDVSESKLILERHYPRYKIEKSSRSIPIDLKKRKLALDVFLDSSSIEVFVNDGAAILSSRIYPDPNQRKFSIYSIDDFVDVSKFAIWDL